ncbi:MAG: hypothetical protein KAX49_06220 [Halanaerobiales bacterium]|nr:hypothetical protein [Halanaerobiales bacterium]
MLVDCDGNLNRRERLDQLEEEAREYLRSDKNFFAEHAIEEIEVWLLAGLDLPNDWNWSDIRSHPHPKEAYYEVYAKENGVLDRVAQGRKFLTNEAMSNWSRIKSKCNELGKLEQRLIDVI